MSVKYHISPSTGNPNKCSAADGNCPYGGESNHYASKDEARAAYEAQQGSGLPSSPQSRLEEQASTYVEHSLWGLFPVEPSRAEMMAASAKAKLENKFVPVAYKETSPLKSLNLELEYDDTGSDRALLQQRLYGIALPSGEFVEVLYETEIGAEYDDYWEYHPYFHGAYVFYENATAYRKKESSARVELDQWERTEEALRIVDSRGGSTYSFIESDLNLTRRAALGLMDKLADPYSAARAARLSQSKKRMAPDVLAGEKYVKSPSVHVRQALASRKELPKKAHEVLAADKKAPVRAELAQRDDLTTATVKTLLQQNDFGDRVGEATVRRHTLAGPSMTASLMKREATNGDLEDLQALARNPKLTKEARSIIERRTDKLGVRLPWGLPFYRQ